MTKILLIILVAGAGWWYFIGGRKLSEEQVRSYYQSSEAAMLDRKADASCALLAEGYRSHVTPVGHREAAPVEQGRAETCDAFRDLYAMWETLGEKLGGELQLDSRYEIHSISLSADKTSATVDVSQSLDVAGSIMNMRARSTDTLIRRNGRVVMLRSDGEVSLRGGGG